MASNFETTFFQKVSYGSQMPNLEPREVWIRILDSVKDETNAVDVIYCTGKQTFGADIKASIDADGYLERKPWDGCIEFCKCDV